MKCSKCGICCQETEMELSQEDIERLERRGHRRERFCIRGDDAIPRLANIDGRCFFYDPDRKQCAEYSSRPTGCRIYPVNIDPDGIIVVDKSCKMSRTLTDNDIQRKGRRLLRLLQQIDREAGAEVGGGDSTGAKST